MDKSKALNVFPIQITIPGKDDIIEGELIRTMAPRTVEKILLKLPFNGRGFKRDNQINLNISIGMGKEKSQTTAKKGAIGYLPLGDAISIFLEDSEPYGGTNIIGHITSNLEVLNSIRMSSNLKISKK